MSDTPNPTTAKYQDIRAEFWARHWERAAPYQTYLQQSDERHTQKWQALELRLPDLTEEQVAALAGHTRTMRILFYSGVWCGDCVRQGPMVKRLADAAGPNVELRFIDREASEELTAELRVLGAKRVPVAVFLSEDFFEIGRFGDRGLTVYRAKARRELGPACPTGLVDPPADELAAEIAEWHAEFERTLLMLRLAPQLRQRHED